MTAPRWTNAPRLRSAIRPGGHRAAVVSCGLALGLLGALFNGCGRRPAPE